MQNNDYYVFEDKKYEAAVRNLKATFFDIIFREEAMLKNLEQRIGTEPNENVRQQMLDLWTKQNESLDQTLGLVENLTNSVKVLDSFISELSSIDEKIVQDIINSGNHYHEDPKYQEQIQNPVNNETEVQEQIPQEDINQGMVQEGVEQNSEEMPPMEETQLEESSIQGPVMTEQNIQEPVMVDVNKEVFEGNSDLDANNEFDISPNSDDAFEPIEEQVQGEPTDEPVIIASETPSDVPEMEKVNEENDGSDLPFIVQPDNIEPEEVPKEEPELSDAPLDIPSYDPEDVKEEDQAAEETTEGANVDENGEVVLETPPEETTDGAESSGDLIPMETEDSEESNVLIPIGDDSEGADEGVIPDASDDLIIPTGADGESTDGEVATDDSSNGTDDSTEGGGLLISMEDTEDESSVGDETSHVDTPRLEKILRSNKDVQIKAIIVNSAQFNKLASSFPTQEALLFGRGVLSEDIYKHSNSVLTTLVKSGGVNLGYKRAEDDKEKQLKDSANKIIQEMLEKANELYKAGKTEESQKMYDAISEMNKSLQIENVAGQPQATQPAQAQAAQPTQQQVQQPAQPAVNQQAAAPAVAQAAQPVGQPAAPVAQQPAAPVAPAVATGVQPATQQA